MPHCRIGELVFDCDMDGVGLLSLDQGSGEGPIDEDTSTREAIRCYIRVDDVEIVVDIGGESRVGEKGCDTPKKEYVTVLHVEVGWGVN